MRPAPLPAASRGLGDPGPRGAALAAPPSDWRGRNAQVSSRLHQSVSVKMEMNLARKVTCNSVPFVMVFLTPTGCVSGGIFFSSCLCGQDWSSSTLAWNRVTKIQWSRKCFHCLARCSGLLNVTLVWCSERIHERRSVEFEN